MPNRNDLHLFPTNYHLILERIQNINPIKYATTRNFINGDITYLSAYISRGVISVHQIKEAVLQKGYKPYEIEKFLQELAWREYYQRVWQVKKENILEDFCNRIAAEIRLPEALNKKLLSPFQYFGITDCIDLTNVKWEKGKYVASELTSLYTKNNVRVGQIISNLDKYTNDLNDVRAIGF